MNLALDEVVCLVEVLPVEHHLPLFALALLVRKLEDPDELEMPVVVALGWPDSGLKRDVIPIFQPNCFASDSPTTAPMCAQS